MNCLTCKYGNIVVTPNPIHKNGAIIGYDGSVTCCARIGGITLSFASGKLECLDYEEKQTSDSK